MRAAAVIAMLTLSAPAQAAPEVSSEATIGLAVLSTGNVILSLYGIVFSSIALAEGERDTSLWISVAGAGVSATVSAISLGVACEADSCSEALPHVVAAAGTGLVYAVLAYFSVSIYPRCHRLRTTAEALVRRSQ